MNLTPELIQFIIQAPMVGVFIWFVLEWSKRNQESANRRDEQWRDATNKRDEQWRLFLTEQREQNREVLERLVVTAEKLEQTLTAHDRKTDAAIATMKERTRPRNKLP